MGGHAPHRGGGCLRSISRAGGAVLGLAVLAQLAGAQGTPSRTPHPRLSPTELLFVTFGAVDGQVVVRIPRRALETDFVVLRRTVVPGAPTAAVPGPAAAAFAPAVSYQGAVTESPALRWRRAGNSLLLLVYADPAHDPPRYRQRAALPILRTTADGTVVVAAAPFVAAVWRGGLRRFPAMLPTAGAASVRPATMWRPQPASAVRTGQVTFGGGWRGVRSRLWVQPLPAVPMRPRLYDPRIGFNGTDASPDTGGAGRYLTRWRLEKRDPTAAVSDVVQPIVYRLSGDIPEQWVPWITKGILAWNPVFEAIGFRNALVVTRDSAVDDPFAAAEQSAAATAANGGRECLVSWQLGGVPNAEVTPDGVTDPRTGELLSVHMQIGNGLPALLQRMYFAWAGAADSVHTRFPYPDSVTGQLLALVAMHETGHSLGLHHNFKAGAAYPTDSLRSAAFVHRFGHTASVMAYSYYNYVAQPEDQIPAEDLRLRIGPYDRWAIGWGYRPIPAAATPEAERLTLEQWRAVQDTAAVLRPSLPEFAGVDPTDQAFVMGDTPERSAEYGARNLARLAARLTATHDTNRVGGVPLREELAKQWATEWGLAVDVLGGEEPRPPYAPVVAQTPLKPIAAARQLRALEAVLAHVFSGQDPLVRAVVGGSPPVRGAPALELFEAKAGWAPEAWQAMQRQLLSRVVDSTRLARMRRQATTVGALAVLPALCARLATLRQAWHAAAADAHRTAAAIRQAAALDTVVAPVFAAHGACQP